MGNTIDTSSDIIIPSNNITNIRNIDTKENMDVFANLVERYNNGDNEFSYEEVIKLFYLISEGILKRKSVDASHYSDMLFSEWNMQNMRNIAKSSNTFRSMIQIIFKLNYNASLSVLEKKTKYIIFDYIYKINISYNTLITLFGIKIVDAKPQLLDQFMTNDITVDESIAYFFTILAELKMLKYIPYGVGCVGSQSIISYMVTTYDTYGPTYLLKLFANDKLTLHDMYDALFLNHNVNNDEYMRNCGLFISLPINNIPDIHFITIIDKIILFSKQFTINKKTDISDVLANKKYYYTLIISKKFRDIIEDSSFWTTFLLMVIQTHRCHLFDYLMKLHAKKLIKCDEHLYDNSSPFYESLIMEDSHTANILLTMFNNKLYNIDFTINGRDYSINAIINNRDDKMLCDVLNILIDRNIYVDVNHLDNLDLLIKYNMIESVRLLHNYACKYKNKTNFPSYDDNGRTILSYAIIYNNKNIIGILLTNPTVFNHDYELINKINVKYYLDDLCSVDTKNMTDDMHQDINSIFRILVNYHFTGKLNCVIKNINDIDDVTQSFHSACTNKMDYIVEILFELCNYGKVIIQFNQVIDEYTALMKLCQSNYNTLIMKMTDSSECDMINDDTIKYCSSKGSALEISFNNKSFEIVTKILTLLDVDYVMSNDYYIDLIKAMKNEISSDHFGSLINEKFSPLIDK
jgi:hypothetical protein